jgi:hypothetical protein
MPAMRALPKFDDEAPDLRDAYREAEASLRLSGLDPSGDPFYESVKARVIAGELALDAAAAEINRHHQNPETELSVAATLRAVHLDAVIESGGTAEEAASLVELRAEGGWGAEEDGTLIRYDGTGNVVEIIESPA